MKTFLSSESLFCWQSLVQHQSCAFANQDTSICTVTLEISNRQTVRCWWCFQPWKTTYHHLAKSSWVNFGIFGMSSGYERRILGGKDVSTHFHIYVQSQKGGIQPNSHRSIKLIARVNHWWWRDQQLDELRSRKARRWSGKTTNTWSCNGWHKHLHKDCPDLYKIKQE